MNIIERIVKRVSSTKTLKTSTSVKDQNKLIDEIHHNFNTEVQRLLAYANIKQSSETEKEYLLDKSSRLTNLGFGATKEVKEADIERDRINAIDSENIVKEQLIEAINYFSMRYPNQKFITEDSVKKICEKYNLIYSTVDRFTGEVPEKNLQEIESFELKEEDRVYSCITRFSAHYMLNAVARIDYYNKEDLELRKKDYIPSPYRTETYKDVTLEIVAPLKDFNLEDSEVKNFKLSEKFIPDPVVLQPVIFKGVKHYLILSAWGQESEDELVVNHKMN